MKRISFDKAAHKEQFRRVSVSPKAVKFAVDGSGNTVAGYAAVWDVLSCDRGGYLASFPAGSMVLPSYPVTLQYNHNDDYLLATEANNTLTVSTDEAGVAINATLDDTFIDKYVLTKISKGTIGGMSLGMYPLQTHREQRTITPEDAQGNPELIDLVGQSVPVEVYDEWLLDECTITGVPSFPQTSIATYKKENHNAELYKLEASIRGTLLD